MPDNRMIPLCKLYENTSKTTGKKYFVGNLSWSSKLLIFQNDDAKESEPGWTVFIAEREPKQQPQVDVIPDPGEPSRRRQGSAF
jgi:hypothetical protein